MRSPVWMASTHCLHCGGKMKAGGVKVSELLALVEADYKSSGKRSLYMVSLYINNQLLPKLGERVANFVRRSHVEEYKKDRLAEKASEVTVNRELAVLKRAFRLGLEDEMINRMPVIKLYPEPEPREGFYEHEQYLAFQQTCRAIPTSRNFDGQVVADIVLYGYYSGWRLRECLKLNKSWIRTEDRLAVLPRTNSKNKRPRIFPLEGAVWEMVSRRLESATTDGLLFHRKGKPVKSIRRMCLKVCDVAGLDSAHFFHNLRRSARTNFTKAGVERETGKKLLGHTVDRVYDNYNQTSITQLRVAVRKVEEYLEVSTQEKQVNGTETVPQELQEVVSESVQVRPANNDKNTLMNNQVSKPNPPKIIKFLNTVYQRFTKGE